LIVLGCAAIEKAAKVLVICDSAFTAGRADASQEQTDAESFDVLSQKQTVRNYLKAEYTISSEEMLIDKAQLMTLTVPQMTVLLGGMRVLNTNFDHSNMAYLRSVQKC
jgi:catalase-peroxidase